MLLLPAVAHQVRESVHLVVAGDFLGLHVLQHRHVGQAVKAFLEHLVRLQLRHKLQNRYMLHNPGQINGRFNAGVASADYGHMFAGKQRSVTVGAIGHTLVLELGFAGDTGVAPAGAGGKNDGFAFEHGTALQLHLNIVLLVQTSDPLGLHHINGVFIHMRLQAGSKLRPFGIGHADEVFDAQGVQHLTTETFGHNAGADALTSRIDGCAGAGGAAAHHQNIEGLLG
ncbi:hypothetical protein D3C75_630090 [compost metagenome]